MNIPQPRPPVVVDGEVTGVRPARPSPLDPGPDGVMPTVLRPTHPAVRHRYAPRRAWPLRLFDTLRGRR